MRLIRRTGAMLPGGYPYTDPKTGMKFDGFDAGGFGDQVLRIIRHRMANKARYPATEPQFLDEAFVANQVDEYQCLRLGNDPRYCQDESQPGINLPAVTADSKCQCGGALLPRYCPTCKGQRIIGYICGVCGKTYPK